MRWYQPVSGKQRATGMTCLQWQRWRRAAARYDLVWAESILQSVILQPHPTRADKWVHTFCEALGLHVQLCIVGSCLL